MPGTHVPTRDGILVAPFKKIKPGKLFWSSEIHKGISKPVCRAAARAL